jgi:cobalt-zinc-cadmium resistance protein CzcA
VRSDVAVKVFGDDMAVLNQTGEQIAAVLQKVPGASEVKVEQTTGLPVLTVNRPRQAARYGLNVATCRTRWPRPSAGSEAGTLFEGDRRFDIVVRLPDELRSDVEAIKRLPIALPAPAAAPARARRRRTSRSRSRDDRRGARPEPGQPRGRQAPHRRQRQRARPRHRLVRRRAREQLQQDVQVPAGYWMSWGGQFEQLQSGASA